MWMCNLSNLLLAVGLLTQRLRLVWIATMWLVVGVPIWAWEAWVSSRLSGPHALLTHCGATVLGLYSVRVWRGDARPRWVVGLASAFGVAAWVSSRFLTPEQLNINVSHRVHDALAESFSSYGLYLAFSGLLVLLGLVITNRLLIAIYSAPDRGN